MSQNGARFIETGEVGNRERYQLLTSLVVPRPIAWISTRSAAGDANLAPFSYFAALAATPMLVGISIGHRGVEPKDTLRNLRETGEFCINVATEGQMEAMNATSGEHPPEVDEFALAGLPLAEAERVRAPYVADCPAVLECRVRQEVDLDGAPNTLVIAEVVAVRLAAGLELEPGTLRVRPESLRAVGRLGGELYAARNEVVALPRPVVAARREG
jgi:flavin reductase (DIM6/NTAB) family NADH-FMN oxidoreductase RutF